MNDIAIAVSTYKKPQALRGWLDSAVNFGRVAEVCVCDDNDGEAREIVEEYQKLYVSGQYPFRVSYTTGPNGGISRNKNRGLKWFLTAPEAAECQWFVLSDDDIAFTESSLPGVTPKVGDALVLAAQESGLRHVTGYLGGSFGKINDDGTVTFQAEPFFKQFLPLAETPHLYFTFGGTQGVLLFFHRSLVELLGYFHQFPGRYGYEHAHYSMRANRIEGRCPELYPLLKNCPEYFHCQGIPNNYEANPNENGPEFEKVRAEVYNGVRLSIQNSGI